MKEIGRIKRLQIQRSTLKPGERLHRHYDPSPILSVQQLLLSPSGVIALTDNGQEIIDLHHADHPQTKNVELINGVSLGFTTHYQTMRAQFGEHLVDGIAGENILVDTDRTFALIDLGQRIIIESQQTGRRVYLYDFMVAAPCVEFTHYAVNHGPLLPAAELKAALQFLDDGRRGFYARVMEQETPIVIQTGDRVYIGRAV
jgi:hypothetical protein